MLVSKDWDLAGMLELLVHDVRVVKPIGHSGILV